MTSMPQRTLASLEEHAEQLRALLDTIREELEQLSPDLWIGTPEEAAADLRLARLGIFLDREGLGEFADRCYGMVLDDWELVRPAPVA